MRRYLFIFIGVFTLIMVACRSNKNFYYQDCAGLNADIYPDGEGPDTNINYGDAVPDTLFMLSGYVDSLRKRNIRIYNNPIYWCELENDLCYFNRNFCDYPENGNDFWYRNYLHDSLNNFRGLSCILRNGSKPKSFDEYIIEFAALYEEYRSPYPFGLDEFSYYRKYIDFYDYDSVVIFSNSKLKESYYAYKTEYFYKKISAGEIEWGDLALKVYDWVKPRFYTSDSIEIQRPEELAEGFCIWFERYYSLCDSIVTFNKLEEKTSLSEYMLWFDKEENVIREFLGKSLPVEVVSDSSLKSVLQESFEYADKRARYFRLPFIIRKRKCK